VFRLGKSLERGEGLVKALEQELVSLSVSAVHMVGVETTTTSQETNG